MKLKFGNILYIVIMLFFFMLTVELGLADEINVEFAGHLGGITNDVAVDGDYAYIGEGQDLVVLDISSRYDPFEVGRINTPSIVEGVAVADGYAYVACGESGFLVVNVTDPYLPTLLGSNDDDAYSVVISSDYAYIGISNGFSILDITNKSSPQIIGQYAPIVSPYTNIIDFTVSYDYVYMTRRFYNGLFDFHIVDINNPSSPQLVSKLTDYGDPRGIAVSDDYAYVADSDEEIVIIDVSDSSSPTIVGNYSTSTAYDVAVLDNHLYIADWSDGFVVVNVSNPSSPLFESCYETGGNAWNIVIEDSYAYVVDNKKGLLTFDISSHSSPDLMSSYNTVNYARSVAVSGNYACIVDQNNGLVIANISDPFSPSYVGRYDIEHFTVNIAVVDNYAYVVDQYEGLLIIDISIPASPKIIGNYDTGDSARGVAVSGDYAYLADGAKGLSIVDISSPSSPTPVTSYYVDSAQDVVISGNYAYVANGKGHHIVNISNPLSPFFEGKYYNSRPTFGLDVENNYVYLSTIGGLDIIDVNNKSLPILAGFHEDYLTYNVDVVDNHAYLASSLNGLRIVDISNSSSPILVGSYDTPSISYDVDVSDDYAYVADTSNGLVILHLATQDKLIKALDSPEVYLLKNGIKHHFTSPEALEWNGYSFDDVIELSSETMDSIPTGDNISISQAIIDKYYEQGGAATFGESAGKGELEGEKDIEDNYCSYVNFEKGAIECFMNGPHAGDTYAVLNPLFSKWGELGYGSGILGYPIDNMSEIRYSSKNTPYKYQLFTNGDQKGALEWNLTDNQVFEVHGAIFAKWGERGYASGILGLITEDEKEAARSLLGTVGRYSKFENGTIHWVSNKDEENENKDYRGESFVTSGNLDELYTNLGGTYGILGFPIMDQIDVGGHGYCEFENGCLVWDEENNRYEVKVVDSIVGRVITFYDNKGNPVSVNMLPYSMVYLTLEKPYSFNISYSSSEDLTGINSVSISIFDSNDVPYYSTNCAMDVTQDGSDIFILSLESFSIPSDIIGSGAYMLITVGTTDFRVPIYMTPFETKILNDDFDTISDTSWDQFLQIAEEYDGILYTDIVPYNRDQNGELVVIASPTFEQKLSVDYFRQQYSEIDNIEINSRLSSLIKLQLLGLSEITKKWPDCEVIILDASDDTAKIERIIDEKRNMNKKVLIVGALPHETVSFQNAMVSESYKASYLSYRMASQINEQDNWDGEDVVFTSKHFRSYQYFEALNSLNKYIKEEFGTADCDYPVNIIAKNGKPLLQVSPTLGNDVVDEISLDNETLYKMGTLLPLGHTYYFGAEGSIPAIELSIGRRAVSLTVGIEPIVYTKCYSNIYEDQVEAKYIFHAILWDMVLYEETLDINENLDYQRIKEDRDYLEQQLRTEVPGFIITSPLAPYWLGKTIGETKIPGTPLTFNDAVMGFFDFQLWFATPHAFISEHEMLQYRLEPSSVHTVISDTMRSLGNTDNSVSEIVIYQNENYPDSVSGTNGINAVLKGAFGLLDLLDSGTGIGLSPTFEGKAHIYNYVGSEDDINSILVADDLLFSTVSDSIKLSNDKITLDDVGKTVGIFNKYVKVGYLSETTLENIYSIDHTSLSLNSPLITGYYISDMDYNCQRVASKSYPLGISFDLFKSSSSSIHELSYVQYSKIESSQLSSSFDKYGDNLELDFANIHETGFITMYVKKFNDVLDKYETHIRIAGAVLSAYSQYTEAMDAAEFSSSQLFYIGDPYLTGYDDPINTLNVTDLPENISVNISSHADTVSFLDTTFIYPNVTVFSMTNVTAKVFTEEWVPFTGAPRLNVFTISILHPENQTVDNVDFEFEGEIVMENISLPYGVLEIENEPVPGLKNNFSQIPTTNIIFSTEQSDGIGHTVLKVFPQTYYSNKTLVYYENISLTLKTKNIDFNGTDVHLKAYPNVISVQSGESTNLSLMILNDIDSVSNATVDLFLDAPSDLSFDGENTTLELGTNVESYYVTLDYGIAAPQVTSKEIYLINASLQFNDGLGYKLKDYSIPVVVVPSNMSDIEIINVSSPSNMSIYNSYNVSLEVINSGTTSAMFIPVKINSDVDEIFAQTIDTLQPNETMTIAFEYTPLLAGPHNLTYAVSALPYETNLEDNFVFRDVFVNSSNFVNISYSPGEITVGERMTFTALNSFENISELVYCSWDFGDNTSSAGKQVNHTYNNSGNYTIALNAIDDNGNEASYSIDIEISDDWNPWNDSDSDGGETVTLFELQDGIYCWRFGVTTSTGEIVDIFRLQDLIYSWRFG